jgi:hypothetical protein
MIKSKNNNAWVITIDCYCDIRTIGFKRLKDDKSFSMKENLRVTSPNAPSQASLAYCVNQFEQMEIES